MFSLEEILNDEQPNNFTKQSIPFAKRVRTFVGNDGGDEQWLCWTGKLCASREAACKWLAPLHALICRTAANRFPAMGIRRKCLRYYKRNVMRCDGGYRVLATGEIFARRLDGFTRVCELEIEVRRLTQKHFADLAQLRAVAKCEAAVQQQMAACGAST